MQPEAEQADTTPVAIILGMWRWTWWPSSWAKMTSISSGVNFSRSVSPISTRRVRPRPASIALAFTRVGAEAQAVDAFDREAGAFGQVVSCACIELGVVDRLDFVEQRHDEDRRELAQDDADDEKRRGRDQPPVRAGVPDDPEQADVERDAKHDGEHVAERPVAKPAAQRLIAEAELVLDDVAGIKRQRERDKYVEQHDDAEERDEPQHRLRRR